MLFRSGLKTPRAMHPEIGRAVQQFSDSAGRELSSAEVHQVFRDEFVRPRGPYELVAYWPRPDDRELTWIHGELKLCIDGVEKTVTASGNGPVSAFVAGMRALGACDFTIVDYESHALGTGADAVAVAYVPLRFADGKVLYGVGTDTNIDQAAVRAIVAALNRRTGR